MSQFPTKPYAAMAICLLLVLGLAATAFGRANGPAGSFTDKEYMRNGTFNAQLDDWGWDNQTTTDNVGAPADPVLVMKTFLSRGPVNAWQEIFLPTTTTAATLSFAYRLVPASQYAYAGSSLGVSVFKTDANFGNPQAITGWWVIQNATADTGWQNFGQTLSSQEIAAIQAARQAGERVFINIQLILGETDNFQAYIDDVSLKLTGVMTYPQLSGAIAYRGVDGSNRYTIGWMRPDGSDRHTLWTYPTPGTGKIFGLAWKPDGSEIAFASDHEFSYSPFHTDVYRVGVDGSLHRVTNPPAQSEIQSGGYAKGTVTGKVHNNSTRNLTGISVYVQGADAPVGLGPVGPGATVDFTLNSVADLGVGRGQYAVLIWFDGSCSNGLYPVPGALIDVQAGGAVDAGTLDFVGNDCTQFEAVNPSWRPDAAAIGFTMNGVAKKVDMAGTLSDPFTTDALGVNELVWSPQGDGKLLYTANPGVYQTTEGDGKGALLVDSVATGVSATEVAWMPDGSGFIFTDGLDLYRYTFATGQVQQLTKLHVYRYTSGIFLADPVGSPSVSPDGKYVIFERRSPTVSNGRDLWMLNLENPVELWPVTEDGRAAAPDWLGREPQTSSPTATPTHTSTPTPNTPTPTPNTPTPTSTPEGSPTATPTPSPGFTPSAWIYLPNVER